MTHRQRLLATAVGMLAAGAPAGAQQPFANGSPAAALALRVDSLLSRHVRPDGPGCAVGVYRNGDAVLTRGYGVASVEDGRPITPRTTFTLGSASKPFTALTALMLEQQGKLSLDDDVRRWVPELPDYGTPIRVRDLLQHTSGLRDFGALNVLMGRDVATMRKFLGLLTAQQALNFAPGTRHEYSHSDYELLGRYVRDEGVLTLMDALRKMTLLPARRLEARAPAMRNKGRIRAGADADITVFDPATVIDRATYAQPLLSSTGIRFVLVKGVVVVRDAEMLAGVAPGVAVRAWVVEQRK